MNMPSTPFDEVIFAEGGEPPSSLIANLPSPKGWTWACNAEGYYTNCSPEVQDVLNIPAGEFLDKSLVSYALAPRSASLLNEKITEKELPIEIFINYQKRNGDLVPVNMHISPTLSDAGDQIGLHGFVQTALIEIDSQLSQETPTAEQIHLGSTIILDTLSEIRKQSLELRSHALSSITMNERLIDPKSRFRKILNGTYANDEEERSASGYKIREIEHKLTWGDKFDLDQDENLYIRKNKYRHPGIRGFFQRLLAPARIVQQDLRWFAVILEVEEEGANILFNYPHEKSGEQKIGLSELIGDPNIILPELKRAIEHPWQSINIFERGKDYLRGPKS